MTVRKKSPELKKVVDNRKQPVHDRKEFTVEWTPDSQVTTLLGAANFYCLVLYGQVLTSSLWSY